MAKTILLADDSITIQKIVNLTFSGEGIDVVTVGNGEAALRKVNEIHPDVILADIFMPGKNGYEVCEHIKNTPSLQHIPVILLVGAFEPFDGNEAIRVKADGHLTKPFEIKVLISAVNSLITAGAEVEAQEAQQEAETREEPAEVELLSQAGEMADASLVVAEAEPPITFAEQAQEKAGAETEAETKAKAVPVSVEVPPKEEKVVETTTSTASIEPPMTVVEEARVSIETEAEPVTTEAVPEPPAVSEPIGITTGVPDEAEPAPELEEGPVAPEEVPAAVEIFTPEKNAVVEEVIGKTAVVPEEEVVTASEPVATAEELVAETSPGGVFTQETIPPQELHAIELEETDPLGLYAADSVYAPIPALIPDSATLDSKNLVVDIWEPKGVLVQTNDVLPELAVEEGISVSAGVVELVQSDSAAERVAQEVMPVAEAATEDPGVVVPVPVAVAEATIQEEQIVSHPPSPVQAEPLSQPAPVPTGLDLEDSMLIDHIVNMVVEKLTKDAIEKIAWEVVPELAELMIKEYVQAHFSNRDGR